MEKVIQALRVHQGDDGSVGYSAQVEADLRRTEGADLDGVPLTAGEPIRRLEWWPVSSAQAAEIDAKLNEERVEVRHGFSRRTELLPRIVLDLEAPEWSWEYVGAAA